MKIWEWFGNFGGWQFCNLDEQCPPPKLHGRRSSVCFQARSWPSLASRWRGEGHSVASLSFWATLFSLGRRRSSPLSCSVFPPPPPFSVEPSPSNQRLRRRSDACPSSASSLRTQPASSSRLISPWTRRSSFSSLRSAPPPWCAHRCGQRVTVSLCYFWLLL